MKQTDDYIPRIRRYDHDALLQLWQQIRQNDQAGFPPGKAFEYLILRAFELEEAEIIWPYDVTLLNRGTIEQIDGVVYAEGLCCLIEAKDYRNEAVNIEPIAKLRNQLLRRPSAAVGVVFSKSGFTEPAQILSTYIAPQTILLWRGEEISLALAKHRMCRGLLKKYRHAIEYGLPDYSLREEDLE